MLTEYSICYGQCFQYFIYISSFNLQQSWEVIWGIYGIKWAYWGPEKLSVLAKVPEFGSGKAFDFFSVCFLPQYQVYCYCYPCNTLIATLAWCWAMIIPLLSFSALSYLPILIYWGDVLDNQAFRTMYKIRVSMWSAMVTQVVTSVRFFRCFLRCILIV